jgi:hypothetical protein
MGYWGVKSYENDQADEALDRGFEAVHGAVYDDLMDDRNPMTPEQVQAKLANEATFQESINSYYERAGYDFGQWDEVDDLGFVGVIVRHAELGVAIPEVYRMMALDRLRAESIDWDEMTLRSLRRSREIELLESLSHRRIPE